MAKRQVSTSAQRESRSSPSHRIKKQTTSTRKAKPREVRRSARLKAVSQLEGSSRRMQPETGLSSAGEASRDQAQPSASHEFLLKRKRDQEALNPSISAQNPLSSKRSRNVDSTH
ncbi:hypothetical protein BDV96DRAFT_630271 [Lophiotrema nucula]|uniref:Uncharacterized protein n=1 Tax=Lophiotrema nucula TaxID=690887 RepID=A0A6A5ZH68_9PLEO|nr:hypothetical protein BDV96DRAFT_630271 [Lophiotrema nucula]